MSYFDLDSAEDATPGNRLLLALTGFSQDDAQRLVSFCQDYSVPLSEVGQQVMKSIGMQHITSPEELRTQIFNAANFLACSQLNQEIDSKTGLKNVLAVPRSTEAGEALGAFQLRRWGRPSAEQALHALFGEHPGLLHQLAPRIVTLLSRLTDLSYLAKAPEREGRKFSLW